MVPVPLAAVVTVKTLGTNPEQIVWLLPMTLAETSFTVTATILLVAVQGTPFSVLVTIL
jgi:uncharacterized paraquat-inducible protein A